MPSPALPTPIACSPRGRHANRRGFWAAWLVLVTTTGGALLPTGAAAADSDGNAVRRAEAIAIEARILFYQKLYAEAAERFLEAFTLAPRTALLYNAARSYEEAKNYGKALALFKHYVTLPDVPADGRADAQARIAVLEKLAEAARNQPAGPSKQLDGKLPGSATGPTEPGKTPELLPFETVGTRERPPEAPRRTFPWAQTAGAVGVAGLATAAWLVARNEADEARALEPGIKTTQDRDDYLARADSARTWQAVAMGGAVVGAALAGWAAYDLLRPRGVAQGPVGKGKGVRLAVAPLPDGWKLGALATF